MDNVYIGYNVTVMPNVRIGENVIVGAGALVSKDLEANSVYVGIPAKKICSFENYVNRHIGISDGGTTTHMFRIINVYLRKRLENAWKFFEASRTLK